MTERKMRQRVIMYLLVVLWAGLIFWFSAQSGDDSSAASGRIVRQVIQLLIPDFEEMTKERQDTILGTVTLIVRKGAHFSEYLVLGGFLWGLVLTYTAKRKLLIWIPWIVGSLYAVSDELHQMFSAGRSPKAADVCIDSAGVICGIMFCLLLRRMWLKKRKVSG